jgi:hypothetical protein
MWLMSCECPAEDDGACSVFGGTSARRHRLPVPGTGAYGMQVRTVPREGANGVKLESYAFCS